MENKMETTTYYSGFRIWDLGSGDLVSRLIVGISGATRWVLRVWTSQG